MHNLAYEMYSKAEALGLFIAHLNKANVLEIQGYTQAAKESFLNCLKYTNEQVI